MGHNRQMPSIARTRFVDWLRRVVSNGQDTAVADAAWRSAAVANAPTETGITEATSAAIVSGPPVWGTASGSLAPRRHELLAGTTSLELDRRARRTRWIAAAGALGVALVVLLTTHPTNPVMVALLVVGPPVYAIISLTSSSTSKVRRRRRQEHLAGYTLTRTSRLDLDQVDPETGYVIRQRGAPALTPEQQQIAIASLPPDCASGPPASRRAGRRTGPAPSRRS